ncbi:MAG: hypothetical protein KDD37_01475 [Bdellovibrionales bacterium]|nr:hypothetical protein [Bdellovibrionales bacterium]
MGNAFTAVADNHDAIYYNVAGLNKIDGMYLTFMDPYFGINDITEIQDALEESDGSTGDDFADFIREIYGQNIWAVAGAKAGITMKNFSLHYYDQGELNAYMTNPAFPTLELTFKNDIGFHLGLAYELVPNFAMGIGVRSISRTGGTYDVSVETLEDLDSDTIKDEITREGVGYGVDLGFMYTIKGASATSSIGFSMHNVGDIAFRTGAGKEPPTSEKSYTSLGLATQFDLPLITIIPALDYKFIDRNDIDIGKKLDLGLEIDFPLLTVRGGLHHGYYTYGATVDLAFLQIDLASYSEELGAYPGQLEDRRYLAQIKIELGLDANFNIFTLDKNNRKKLKQRR